jgi:excisionase family DNA binding protein
MSKPEYISKRRAAEALGISPRRLLELSQSGQIRRHYHNDPQTRRRAAFFARPDVERLAAERIQAAPQSATTLAIPGGTLRPSSQAIALPAPAARPWLPVDEAADYTGLPASFLTGMIAAGQLAALDVGVRAGGRWRVNRRDLDAIKGVRSGRG